jgi:hypothetical protein
MIRIRRPWDVLAGVEAADQAVISSMLAVASWVLAATSWVLAAVSSAMALISSMRWAPWPARVTCSRAAAAISAARALVWRAASMIWLSPEDTRLMTSLPSPTASLPFCMLDTAVWAEVWIWVIMPAIWSALSALPSASLRTSSATTAKPRPASPARAASMAALRASRLVWSAMLRMMSTTSPIFSLLSPRV